LHTGVKPFINFVPVVAVSSTQQQAILRAAF
jgi:hypothetical protein